ncbi:MAG: hypothetical protein ACQEP8_03515 [Chlamydiota bacterium]
MAKSKSSKQHLNTVGKKQTPKGIGAKKTKLKSKAPRASKKTDPATPKYTIYHILSAYIFGTATGMILGILFF